MKFKDWFVEKLLSEAPAQFAGTKKGRPGGGVVANRSQLWGPSADFSHDPDQLQKPLDRIIPGVLQGIGTNIGNEMGIQPTQVSMFHSWGELGHMMKKQYSDDRIVYSLVLPLQIPSEGNVQSVNPEQIVTKEADFGQEGKNARPDYNNTCLLYTSPSPRD